MTFGTPSSVSSKCPHTVERGPDPSQPTVEPRLKDPRAFNVAWTLTSLRSIFLQLETHLK